VTVAHYFTPNGTDISHKGVTPDIKIDLSEDQRKQLVSNPSLLGTTNDPQYAQAIAVLRSGQLAKPPVNKTSPSASIQY